MSSDTDAGACTRGDAARAVVADDGREVRLTAYGADGATAAVPLAAMAALNLGHRLIEAGLRQLTRAAGEHRYGLAPAGERRKRGGDHHAEKRAKRDQSLRALAEHIGNGMPPQRQARELKGRLERYRPMENEATRERMLMRQVIDAGLAIPGPDRLKRILKSG